jgi:hypothetical protein
MEENWSQIRRVALLATKSFLLSSLFLKNNEKNDNSNDNNDDNNNHNDNDNNDDFSNDANGYDVSKVNRKSISYNKYMKKLIPNICINRFYVADGVKNIAVDVWKIISKDSYNSDSDSNNDNDHHDNNNNDDNNNNNDNNNKDDNKDDNDINSDNNNNNSIDNNSNKNKITKGKKIASFYIKDIIIHYIKNAYSKNHLISESALLGLYEILNKIDFIVISLYIHDINECIKR